jgi:hypothetical protein
MNLLARRFVLLLLGAAFALAGGLALLNYIVDPYNRFGHNRLGVYISAERESKPNQVQQYPHNALLLGNSRMAMVPAGRLKGFRFFNGAFGGGSAEEVYYFTAHYARQDELVVVGVDAGSTDPYPLQGDIFAPASCTSVLNNLLNLQTVEYSVRTISEHWAGHPSSLRADGSFEPGRWFELYDRDNPARRDWQLAEMKRSAEHFACPARDRMSFYVRLADCLRQRSIVCVAVVPPLQEAVAKHLENLPVRAAYQAWTRQLRSIFPHVVDLSFSSYGAAENFFKADPVHFKPDVAVQMFNAEVIPVALEALRRQPARSPPASPPPSQLPSGAQ